MSTGNTQSPSAKHEHHFAHHFRSAMHEFLTSKEGIWVFMVSEIMMFGGLFLAYFIFHAIYPEMFAEGAAQLDWRLGSINTLILIASSFTMALSIHDIQNGRNSRATWLLAFTLLCGAGFLGIKGYEYAHKIHEGLLPGHYFHYAEAVHSNLSMYFGMYFCMTGLHGLHVIIGMACITWVMVRNIRGDFNPEYYTAVEGVGILWHVVDLIWIFLFPLLYLVG